MDYDKLLLPIGAAWVIVCIFFAVMGRRNKQKPNPKFEKVPIIVGISVPVAIGILALIAYVIGIK
jgi:hypothetical protein